MSRAGATLAASAGIGRSATRSWRPALAAGAALIAFMLITFWPVEFLDACCIGVPMLLVTVSC